MRKSQTGLLRRIAAVSCVLLVAIAAATWGGRMLLQSPEDIPVIYAEVAPYKLRPEDPGGKTVPYTENELYATINPDEKREIISLRSPDNWQDDLAVAISGHNEGALDEVAKDVDLIEQAAQEEEELEALGNIETGDIPPQEKPVQEVQTGVSQTDSVPEEILQSLIESQTYYIQLGALSSEDLVHQEWSRLRTKFSQDLDNLTLNIQRASAQSSWYRLRAGALASYGEASELCARLISKGQDCLVVTQ